MSAVTPLLSFSFSRERCAGGFFFGEGMQASAVGSMNSLQPQIGCLNGDGISSASKVASYLTVGSLKTFLGTKVFAIEMWLRPQLNVTTTATVFAIGKDLTSAPDCKNNLAVRRFACILFQYLTRVIWILLFLT